MLYNRLVNARKDISASFGFQRRNEAGKVKVRTRKINSFLLHIIYMKGFEQFLENSL